MGQSRAVNRTLAVAGVIAVVLITAIMLASANVYFWEYPPWAWALILVAALALCANALGRPESAFSPLSISVSILIGLALGWPVTVGGEGWWPVWLAVGIVMPLLGCWLLRSFSLAFRKA